MLWKKGFKVLEIRLLKDWSFEKRGHLKRNDQLLKQKYLLSVLMENCLWGRKCESWPCHFLSSGLRREPQPKSNSLLLKRTSYFSWLEEEWIIFRKNSHRLKFYPKKQTKTNMQINHFLGIPMVQNHNYLRHLEKVYIYGIKLNVPSDLRIGHGMSLPRCITLGKSPNLSVPLFPVFKRR